MNDGKTTTMRNVYCGRPMCMQNRISWRRDVISDRILHTQSYTSFRQSEEIQTKICDGVMNGGRLVYSRTDIDVAETYA